MCFIEYVYGIECFSKSIIILSLATQCTLKLILIGSLCCEYIIICLKKHSCMYVHKFYRFSSRFDFIFSVENQLF